jgi:hypothetical protein
MVKKVLAIGTIAALTGLVGASGCTSTVTTVTTESDASTSDSGKAATTPKDGGTGTSGDDDDTSGDDDDDNGGSNVTSGCPGSGTYKAPAAGKPVAPAQNECSFAILDVLKEACALDPRTADCQAARNDEANKACADCIFSNKTDAQWKVVVIDPTKPFYNQAGCVELMTGVDGCGERYAAAQDCLQTFCRGCTEADVGSCGSEAIGNECKTYAPSGDCANAIVQVGEQTIAETCYAQAASADAYKAVFVSMGTVACMKD